MRVGLFIPCYIDQYFPRVAIATLQLLEKMGVKIVYPKNQTCCGQPMGNSGFEHLATGCSELFIEKFANFDYIVAPSGSCVLHIKDHLISSVERAPALEISNKIYELTAFLTDVLNLKELNASFPHKVGFHQSCHGQRGLHLSQMNELLASHFSKPHHLLNMVKGIDIVALDRTDEYCSFGGTFCITEETVSIKMRKDRFLDHLEHKVEFITGVDLSCLMHLEGILKRQSSTVKIIHIAEILNSQKKY